MQTRFILTAILNSVFQMRATGGMITLMRMGVGEKVNPAALTQKRRSWAIPMQCTDTERHMMVSREKVSLCLLFPGPLPSFLFISKWTIFSVFYSFFDCHSQMSMDLKTSHTMKIATGKFLNPNHPTK